MAWRPDGELLAVVNGHDIHLWSTATDTVAGVLSGHTEAITDVAWAPDGRHLATAAADQSARIWDASSGQWAHTVPEQASKVAWSPDGKTLAVTDGRKTTRIWSVTR